MIGPDSRERINRCEYDDIDLNLMSTLSGEALALKVSLDLLSVIDCESSEVITLHTGCAAILASLFSACMHVGNA